MTTQTTKEDRTVTAKGIHRFVICDGMSNEAKKIAINCEKIKQKRLEYILGRDMQLMPMQLRLQELNMRLGQMGLEARPCPIQKGNLTEEQRSILYQISKISAVSSKTLYALWEDYRTFMERLEERSKKREYVIENITTTVGRSVLAQRLGGDTTYTGTVNYTALGSDNTAAAVGDATLGTEVYRKALSSGTDVTNVSYLETFFNATETSGTYQEYGMFIDGTGSADTGQLFNRFVTAITKSVTETLNVQSIITFADA